MKIVPIQQMPHDHQRRQQNGRGCQRRTGQRHQVCRQCGKSLILSVNDSFAKCIPSMQTADYMVSFMDYVDPSKKMLECRLQAKIRGVKRPIGVTVLPDQSVVVSSSGEPNEVGIILK